MRDERYDCPLVHENISDTFCYEVQSALNGLLEIEALYDFEYDIDINDITKDNWEKHCKNCTFKQL